MSDNNIVNQNAETQESSIQEATATTNPPVSEKAPKVESAHDDFDWSIDKRNVATYSSEEKKKYDSVYEGTFKAVTDGELVKGIVVGLTKNGCCHQYRF